MRLPLVGLALVVGCGSCGEDARVEGPHPYVRCALGDGFEDSFTVGGVTVQGEGAIVEVRGLREWAAFVATEGAPQALASLGPELPWMVLGGLRDEASAQALREAAGERLVFVLPGGDDDLGVLDDLLDAEDGWVDLRGVRELRLEHGTFVVLPGAPDGRYALGDGRCGWDDEDLERFRGVGAAPGPRWWLSWAAPRGTGPYAPDLGFAGIHVGDRRLTALGEAEGVSGGIFAWPETQAGVVGRGGGSQPVADEAVADLSVVVPRAGEAVERGDESRLPSGVVLIEADAEGLRAAFRPL